MQNPGDGTDTRRGNTQNPVRKEKASLHSISETPAPLGKLLPGRHEKRQLHKEDKRSYRSAMALVSVGP